MKKVREQQVLEMTSKLCDKLLNGKEQNRDIASIALKTIVAEVPTSSVAQTVLVSISPKLIRGITTQVSAVYSSSTCHSMSTRYLNFISKFAKIPSFQVVCTYGRISS